MFKIMVYSINDQYYSNHLIESHEFLKLLLSKLLLIYQCTVASQIPKSTPKQAHTGYLNLEYSTEHDLERG